VGGEVRKKVVCVRRTELLQCMKETGENPLRPHRRERCGETRLGVMTNRNKANSKVIKKRRCQETSKSAEIRQTGVETRLGGLQKKGMGARENDP